MNSKSNKYFKSESFKLTLKDYLILGIYLIVNTFLVVLFFHGDIKLELIIINHLIFLGFGIIVSTIITIYILKKLDY